MLFRKVVIIVLTLVWDPGQNAMLSAPCYVSLLVIEMSIVLLERSLNLEPMLMSRWTMVATEFHVQLV